MKFRPHRELLDDAMKEVVEFNNKEELSSILNDKYNSVDTSNFKVESYGGYDERIGWDTHIVTLEGYGVLGFTDSPVEEE